MKEIIRHLRCKSLWSSASCSLHTDLTLHFSDWGQCFCTFRCSEAQAYSHQRLSPYVHISSTKGSRHSFTFTHTHGHCSSGVLCLRPLCLRCNMSLKTGRFCEQTSVCHFIMIMITLFEKQMWGDKTIHISVLGADVQAIACNTFLINTINTIFAFCC